MRDPDIDLACLTAEGEDVQPLRLRYGVTAQGQPACCSTSEETEPSSSPGSPPKPCEPTTTSLACSKAFTRAAAGEKFLRTSVGVGVGTSAHRPGVEDL